MTVQNHNQSVANERPAVAVQDPVTSGATDRRSYEYRGYSVAVGPCLVGFSWSIANTDRMARAMDSHKTVKEASQEAEKAVDYCIRMYHQ